MDLQDKVAVITGGASGLGRATAEMVINNGGKVAIIDLNEELAGQTAKELGARDVLGNDSIVKISLVGVGMRSHAGIASKMFEALAQEGINIRMISTSEIKISVVVDEKYLELGVRALHQAFDLDKTPEMH